MIEVYRGYKIVRSSRPGFYIDVEFSPGMYVHVSDLETAYIVIDQFCAQVS